MFVKWVDNSNDLLDPFWVRQEVFIKEQGVPSDIEMDELDKVAEHVVVYCEDRPIGTGRIVLVNGEFLLGRIAVLKEYRNKKVGKLVVEELLKNAEQKGAKEVHIHSQIRVKGFYESIGFVAYGNTYFEAGIEHINMIKKITR